MDFLVISDDKIGSLLSQNLENNNFPEVYLEPIQTSTKIGLFENIV